ncbi:Acetyltransferase (GNAT) family protein [Amycolatopsis marina]|uniref:Acetyltransferase (GNAT) family protein n=1 Tax=Amycolatopsis marina TaxID=490629 RepID=A0A1I0VK34_9PSEU|nr:GNAT family N-acetyltransferase [Amycolatopsis marina]SFA76681.1 Acetyltransferase (GNAT) family protein [Amycolatopsis marina]
MDIEVAKGDADDVDLLAPLWKAMVEHHRSVAADDWPVREQELSWDLRQREYRKWLEDSTGFLLIARTGNVEAPVGYAFGRLMASGPTFDLGGIRGEVESLVVAADVRSHGVGTALLDACRDELRRRGCGYWSVSVMEANAGAVQLYERLGFRPWIREMLGHLDERTEGQS